MLTDEEILFRFLGTRARRFVRSVRDEWAYYSGHPMSKARSGCLKRDAIRVRLEKLAYFRYPKTVP